MPHQCTKCEKIYEDGEKDILEGCSNCGSRKFQYLNSRPSENPTQENTNETAQQTARKEFATDDEISDSKSQSAVQNTTTQDISNSDIPNQTVSVEKDTEKLKETLDSQFEGIRIIERGKYQLNLMQLYKNNTQVISIEEDGRYIINVSEVYNGS